MGEPEADFHGLQHGVLVLWDPSVAACQCAVPLGLEL